MSSKVEVIDHSHTPAAGYPVRWAGSDEDFATVATKEVGLVEVRRFWLYECTWLTCAVGGAVYSRYHSRCYSLRYCVTLAKRWARELVELHP